MTTRNFNVKNGMTAGNITLDASTTGNANVSTVTSSLGIKSVFTTYTDNVAAASATIANAAIHALAAPNLAATNTAVTFTNAATFYVAGAPVANTNATITNPYSIFVSSGNSFFGGNVTANFFIGNGSQLTGITVAAGSSIVNGTSNVSIPASGGNVNISVGGTANVVVVTSTAANVLGTLTANNHTVAGAATGIVNVAATLGNLGFRSEAATYTDAAATGTQANAAIHYLAQPTIGGGTNAKTYTNMATLFVANAPAATTNAAITNSFAMFVAAGNSFFGGNILGTLANGNSNVRIATASGNVTLTAVGNTTMTITGTGANISGTANVSGNANVGNIDAATGVFTTAANTGLVQNGTSNVTIASGANVSIFTAGNATAQFVVTSTGANIPGTANVVGNANVGNLGTATAVITTGNITTINSGLLQNGNSNITLTANGNVSIQSAGSTVELVVTSTGANVSGTLGVSGNATVGNLIAGGGAGGNITGANLVSANFFTGTLTTAAQPNITSVGSLTAPSLGVSGTITAVNITANTGIFTGNANGLSSITGANVIGAVGSATFATTAGTVTTAAQPNITSVGTLTSLTSSGNISGANVISTNNHVFSVATAISAAGTVQSNATAITKDFNVVSTVASGAGVRLPTAIAGYRITVLNTSANALLVYPATSGIINSAAANAAYSQPAGARLDYISTTTTQWYTLNATYG